MKAFNCIEKIERYVQNFPNATEKQYIGFVKRNSEDVLFLIPGGNSQQAWLKFYNQIITEQL
jgi:hypothetical protein